MLCYHDPLQYLLQNTKQSPKLTRLALSIQEFDAEIQHIKGAETIAADGLSHIIQLTQKEYIIMSWIWGSVQTPVLRVVFACWCCWFIVCLFARRNCVVGTADGWLHVPSYEQRLLLEHCVEKLTAADLNIWRLRL